MSLAPRATVRTEISPPGSHRHEQPGLDGAPRAATSGVWEWTLAGGLVLYLAADGGGYDQVVHSQIGIVVWWILLLCAAAGLLPRARLTLAAWGALCLFAAFVAWSALSSIWSLSVERTLQDTSLVAGYLGILALGIALHRDRERAIRATANAIAATVAFVAALALASRLIPGLFPAAKQTGAFLPGSNNRLAWPLDYWNALAALMALGVPLLLAAATGARTLAGRAAAAAGLPLVILCGYLTFSRGGAIAVAVAVLAFFALTSERIPKLATAFVGAAGAAVVVASAASRPAIENGLRDSAARHQGATLIVILVVMCAAVALAQLGISVVVRRLERSHSLAVRRRRAEVLLAAGAVVVIVAAVAGGAPHRLSHAWQDFKRPSATALAQNSLGRFGAASGNGRYQYWRVAVHYAGEHPLDGGGAGTFQLIWLPRATIGGYVQNAHSLYVETLAELGIIGLALLAGFLVLVLTTGVKAVVQASDTARAGHFARVYAAGVVAALVTFCVSAASDWIWQVPVLPAAFLLLSAAVLAPQGRSWPASRHRWPFRMAAVAVAVVCLVAIGYPLAVTSAVRRSQTAASAGNSTEALGEARTAVRLEPGSASAQLQLAVVLEDRRDFSAALAAARHATRDEPSNWSTWLVRSRLEAENENVAAALAAYRRARSLNPRSPLFAQVQ